MARIRSIKPRFVRQQYLDFLNREPDPPGFGFWTNEIDLCGVNQACIEVRRINVSAAFFLSIEFQETGYLVYRMYKAGYGNLASPASAPVPLRLGESLPDTQRIGQGVVVGSGTGNRCWKQTSRRSQLNSLRGHASSRLFQIGDDARHFC